MIKDHITSPVNPLRDNQDTLAHEQTLNATGMKMPFLPPHSFINIGMINCQLSQMHAKRNHLEANHLEMEYSIWKFGKREVSHLNRRLMPYLSPEYSLEGPMLRLQYFGHLMGRALLWERTLMLAKIESRRRKGQQRMRCLDGITDSMDMKVKVKSLSRVQLFATPWTVAYQAPPSMGFSRQ